MTEVETYVFVYHDSVADEHYAVLAPTRSFAPDFLPETWRSRALPEPKQYGISDIDTLMSEARDEATNAQGEIAKHQGEKYFGKADADRQEAYARREAFCENLVQVKLDLIRRGLVDSTQ